MTPPKPDPRPRSGKHPHPTEEEHTAALALLASVRRAILPGAPELLTVRAVEERLGLTRGSIRGATTPLPGTSRRLGSAARGAMEALVEEMAPKGRGKKDRGSVVRGVDGVSARE